MTGARAALAKAASGGRISVDEALDLYCGSDLLELGLAAGRRSLKVRGDGPVTFLIDRNINYTNICENRCRFCAFFRDLGAPDAYLLSHGEILGKVGEAVQLGATQIMIQGGLHPELDLSWYVDLFRAIKTSYPISLHSLSPPEVAFIAKKSKMSTEETLLLLRAAGLDSLPGGGAEILVDAVRERISPRKIGASGWLSVMRAAHGIGMPTTATMMFGTGETVRDRIDHLDRVRNLQDDTGGFLSFIPWTFQPANTNLGKGGASAVDYLRTLALSRLFLDNVVHIQGSWVTQGPEVGQVSLDFGADDLGSIMLEENVVKAAGTSHRLTRDDMKGLIEATGRRCAQRDTLFNRIHTF